MVEYSIEFPEHELLPKPASFISRLLAFIIDLLVFNFIIYSLFMSAFQAASGISNELLNVDYVLLKPKLLGAVIGALSASLVLLLVYLSLFEALFGQTIGKHFLGLKLAFNHKSSFNTLLIRNLFKSLFIFLLPFDLLGMALLPSRQRFIDEVLGVSVLSTGRINLHRGLT